MARRPGRHAGGRRRLFVSGGTAGNLSALVAARHAATAARGGERPRRWQIACADTVHSSVASAARVMDVDLLTVLHDERGRLTGSALSSALDRTEPAGAFAVVASAGSTNAGIVDDLEGLAAVCRDEGLWLHVDGAYGGAGLLAPSVRERFRGIEHADSLIVDPHKWLFAPYDSCALVYRPRDRAVGAPTGRLLPGRAQRELRVEPERLRPSPLPAREDCPLVLAGDLRDRRLPRRRRAGPARSRGRRPRRSAAVPARA